MKSVGDDVIRLLLENGADPNEFERDDAPILWWAVVNDCESVVQLLVEAVAEIDLVIKACDFALNLPLFTAIGWEHVAIAKYLIDHGADVNVVDKSGHGEMYCVTPIVVRATQSENEALVRALLQSPDIKLNGTDLSQIPLIYAAKQGNLGIVRLLVENGVRINYGTVARRRMLCL